MADTALRKKGALDQRGATIRFVPPNDGLTSLIGLGHASAIPPMEEFKRGRDFAGSGLDDAYSS